MQEQALRMPGVATAETLEAILRHAKIEFRATWEHGAPVLWVARGDYTRVREVIHEWSNVIQWIAHAI